MFHGFGQDISLSNFLKSVTSRHCLIDSKEACILDRCGLHLKGDKLGVINIVIYGKQVLSSLKSFEQCIRK